MAHNDWTDLPIDKQDADRLDFDEYSQILAEIAWTAGTPLTIGIFGPWGSGKTSLMRLVEQAVADTYKLKAPTLVRFSAWHYDKEEALWRALIIRVLDALRPQVPPEREAKKEEAALLQELDDLEASLYKVVEREETGGITVDWEKAVKGVALSSVHLGLSLIPGLAAFTKVLEEGQKKFGGDDMTRLFDAIQQQKRKIYREHIRSMEQFQDNFAAVVKAQVVDNDRRLLVFIDDLDRCLPEKAIEVLEALKLFLDVPGCVFFLGADRQIIQRGIQVKYKGFLPDSDDKEAAARRVPISGDDYLEKIVQLPFHLLPLDSARIRHFIDEGDYDLPEGCAAIFAAGMQANPRKVKRALHIFLLLQKLAGLRHEEFLGDGAEVPFVPQLLAKIVVIQSRHRRLYQALAEEPEFMRYLERHMFAEIEPDEVIDERYTEWLKEGDYLSLRQMLRSGPRFDDLPAGGIDRYLYLTAATDEERQEADARSRQARLWRYLLSGDRARIERAVTAVTEAGAEAAADMQQQLTMALTRRDGRDYTWQEFVSMGQALALLGDARDLSEMVSVLNGDYPVGLDDELESVPGFRIGRYLVTNAQYQAFIDEHPDQPVPDDWDAETRQFPAGKANYPVVNVSHADASAYAAWRQKRLPEAREWDAAAYGAEGRPYPFGGTPERGVANTQEAALGQPSPVGAFPDDVSPFGLFDMAGNVSEWTLDEGDPIDGESAFVVKGSSWELPMQKAGKRTNSLRMDATDKSATVSFRLVE